MLRSLALTCGLAIGPACASDTLHPLDHQALPPISVQVENTSAPFVFACPLPSDVNGFETAMESDHQDALSLYADRGCMLVFNRSRGVALSVSNDFLVLVAFHHLDGMSAYPVPIYAWTPSADLVETTFGQPILPKVREAILN